MPKRLSNHWRSAAGRAGNVMSSSSSMRPQQRELLGLAWVYKLMALPRSATGCTRRRAVAASRPRRSTRCAAGRLAHSACSSSSGGQKSVTSRLGGSLRKLASPSKPRFANAWSTAGFGWMHGSVHGPQTVRVQDSNLRDEESPERAYCATATSYPTGRTLAQRAQPR